jgi:hypothetical protein
MLESGKPIAAADHVLLARKQMKQPRFDAVNSRLSVADVCVEALRGKHSSEASALRFAAAY